MRTFATLIAYCLTALVLAPTVVKADGSRLALVVGNGAYTDGRLANPANDAKDVAELLRKAGFDVALHVDTNKEDLSSAVHKFGKQIRNPAVKMGVFYYAGHGIQREWRNYMVPVTAKIKTAGDVLRQTVEVSDLLGYMTHSKGRSFIVVLDACRDDPFGHDYRPSAKGLSPLDAPAGSLLAYSTAPGSVAKDGEGRNGLYTSHLLKEFSQQGVKIEDAFKRVRLNVRIESQGRQVPWENTSLEDDVYIFPSVKTKLTESEQEDLLERELAAWSRVKNSQDITQLVEFIRQFPSGVTSELAQSRLNRLLRAVGQNTRPVSRIYPHPRAFDRFRWVDGLFPKAYAAEPLPEPYFYAPLVVATTPYFKGQDEHQRAYQVGDEYRFDVVDGFNKSRKPLVMKVTQVDVANDSVSYNNGEYGSDLMGNITRNVLRDGIQGSFDTPRQFYPADLYVGKKWETKFKQTRSNGAIYQFIYRLRVVGKERVTVPAGTFDTYKIEARGFNLSVPGSSLQRNIWVAPGVSPDIAHETIVRLRNGTIDQYDRQELVSITRAQ